MKSDMSAVTILLVEDEDSHATLIERNLRPGGITNQIIRKSNGRDALDYLLNRDAKAEQVLHKHLLVLLDLNMPEVDGYQVLKAMKEDDACRVVPVIILTTTNDPHEVQRCYDLGCNSFVCKPVHAKEFAKALQDLGLFINIMSMPCCQ